MPARSKYGVVDSGSPEAAVVCDRGGEVRRHSELLKEMIWTGNRLVWNGKLCCKYHIDVPNPQGRLLILPADPVPVFNPRSMQDPIFISAFNQGFLTEQDFNILTTENNSYLTQESA